MHFEVLFYFIGTLCEVTLWKIHGKKLNSVINILNIHRIKFLYYYVVYLKKKL